METWRPCFTPLLASTGSSSRSHLLPLLQHIQTLLSDWESELQRCSLLFVHALGSSSSALFGGRAPPLSRRDPRLRPVPFATRRPTHAEVLRVYTELSTVHVFGRCRRARPRSHWLVSSAVWVPGHPFLVRPALLPSYPPSLLVLL